jgi:3-deoxy-D-manno-octulosonic-acid transferase
MAPETADPSTGKLRVWLHAASVGEIAGAHPVLQNLARTRLDLEFVITTMTEAGRDAARRRLDGFCQLAPFDYLPAVRAFIDRIRPVLVLIAETELWPNFLVESSLAGAKVALINARISSRSMSRYRLIAPLIACALRNVNAVLAQTADDAERFRTLGAAPGRIAITGNSKYEIRSDLLPLRSALDRFAEGRQILIAGSTGPGEEQIVLSAYRALCERFARLALVIAPRHLGRLAEVENALRTTGCPYLKASESSPSGPVGAGTKDAVLEIAASPQVLLLDTMGELAAFYQRATIAFIGGSLMPGRGGQSLAEPANAAVPVLFGPYYENHRQLGDALIRAGAGCVVRNASHLADAAGRWLADERGRNEAGQQARSVVQQLSGSTTTTVAHLCALLPAA